MRIGTDRDGRSVYFVHVPRTGGTSLRRWLGGDWETLPHEHRPLRELRGLDREAWGFGVVRDPFDRVVSQFHHDHPGIPTIAREAAIAAFREWVPRAGILWHSQWAAKTMLEGCERVFQFAGAGVSIADMLIRSGLPVPSGVMPHENKSSRVAATADYYDDRTANHVVAVCRWEIDQYGYEMPDKEVQ